MILLKLQSIDESTKKNSMSKQEGEEMSCLISIRKTLESPTTSKFFAIHTYSMKLAMPPYILAQDHRWWYLNLCVHFQRCLRVFNGIPSITKNKMHFQKVKKKTTFTFFTIHFAHVVFPQFSNSKSKQWATQPWK